MIALELAYPEKDWDKTAPLYHKLKQIIDCEKGPGKIYLGGTPLLWVLEREYSDLYNYCGLSENEYSRTAFVFNQNFTLIVNYNE